MNLHTACLLAACQDLQIEAELVADSDVFVKVILNQKPQYFIANQTGLNDQIVERIADDKKYTYDILKDSVQMPLTNSFIDPNAAPAFRDYVEYENLDQIADQILRNFNSEVVIKPNNGSQGRSVTVCKTKAQIIRAAQEIFNRHNQFYTHVLIAQPKIEIAREFRVVVLDKKIILVYEKDFSKAKFEQNISPFHADGTRAVIIHDQMLIKKIQEFINPIFSKLDLVYGGLDVAIDNNGQLWLFEINVRPGYNFLVRDNSQADLVEIYKKILKYLQKK